MKTCTKCGETKPTTEFQKRSTGLGGFRANCKMCIKAQLSVWKSKNPGKMKSYSEAWAKANPDKVKAANAKWNAKNHELARIHSHNRRALKAGGKLSKGLSEKLFKLQRGKCACGCGQPLGDDYHMDHRMPLALMGTNTDDNIQLLRSTCNQQKSAKHPIDFMQSKGFLL